MNQTRLEAYMLMNYNFISGTNNFEWWIEYTIKDQLNMLEKHQQHEITDQELLEYAYKNRPKS